MKLEPISIDYLYEGLLVDYPIYYKEKNELILLCKDLVLSETQLQSLRTVLESGGNIYVDDDHRASLLDDTRFFVNAQKRLEAKLNMTNIRESAKEIITGAGKDGYVMGAEVDKMVTELTDKLGVNDAATIIQCVSGMREVDEYLFTHSVNVALLNGLIARWIHMSDDACEMMVRAGSLHDVGKVRVSPKILNKPGKLTTLEFESVKMHTKFGRQILEDSGETDKDILSVAELHHEKENGTGYPYGLKGNEIPTPAAATAVSDIYDAMVARRSYKKEASPFDILDQISKNAFSGLDMKIINIFLQNMPAELMGAHVLLSNGATAKVKYINPSHYKYPVVELDGELIQTSEKLSCVRIYTL